MDLSALDWNKLLYRFRYPFLLLLVGLILGGFGFLLYQTTNETKVEILESSDTLKKEQEIVVEAGGAFEKPGVYKLPVGSRVEDLFTIAGGISVNADRFWIERSINRAAKLTDGQKVFVPTLSADRSNNQSNTLSANISGLDQNIAGNISSQGRGLVNINT